MTDISKINFNNTSYDLKDAQARTDINTKINKSGDTMTGNLVIQASTTADNKVLRFIPATTTKMLYAQIGIRNEEQMYLWQRTAAEGSYLYQLPAVDPTGTGNHYFNILTSENIDATPTANSDNPVKSSGIKTALDTKIDKTDMADSTWLTLAKPTDATFTGTIWYRKIGKLVCVIIDSIKGITGNTTIGSLPSGYRPPTHIFYPLTGGYNLYRVQGIIRVYSGGGIQVQFTDDDQPKSSTQFYAAMSYFIP